MKMPENVKFIISQFNKNGFMAFAVGGCVRDTIMGKNPNDWDIATNALPEETKACFEGFNVIETGIKHGTVTVIIDKTPYEITTFRVDGKYSDNRRPESVQFTNDIKDDLARRDFTINAMAASSELEIIDVFGGRQDIQNKIIRCVGDPDTRFNEDALRIMRALRFAATLGFEIDECTSEAIIKNAHLLKNISPERICAEFSKLICGINATKILDKYRYVIAEFIPEITDMFGFAQNTPYHIYDVWQHTLAAMDFAENEIKLAVFFHDIGKPESHIAHENGVSHFYGHAKKSAEMAREILKRLKYDNSTINTVCDVILFHDTELNADEKSVKRLLSKIGYEKFKTLLKLKKADDLAKNPEFDRSERFGRIEKILEKIIERSECFSLKQLAVNGDTLISLGLKEGALFKTILNDVLERVIGGEIENNKAELTKYIKSKFIDM